MKLTEIIQINATIRSFVDLSKLNALDLAATVLFPRETETIVESAHLT